MPEVPLTVLAGALAGAEDVVEVRRRALPRLDVPRRRLPFASGIPGHDTLSDIMKTIDAEPFGTCFRQGVELERKPGGPRSRPRGGGGRPSTGSANLQG